MDGQLARGNGVGDRIDQERHVIVDDRHPHAPTSGLTAGRFKPQHQLAAAAAGGDIGDERRRFDLFVGGEAIKLTRKRIAQKRVAQPLDGCRSRARGGRHNPH